MRPDTRTASFLLTLSLTSFALIACASESDSTSDAEATGATSSTGATSGSGGVSGTGATGTGTGAASTGATTSTGGTAPLVNFTVGQVTTWRNDATAAYTIFHDDTCDVVVDSQFSIADPELAERGLVASFGAVAKHCEDRNLWSQLETLRAHGHEIVNHSWDHTNFMDAMGLGVQRSTIQTNQIDNARTTLQANLSNLAVTFFIFPEDAFDPGFLEYLEAQGYLGARAGARGFNNANFPDDFRVQFDVYGPGYSIYTLEGANAGTPCESAQQGEQNSGTDACRTYILNHYLDEVIAAGGYGIRELHGVGDGWEPVPPALYESHLDYVKSKMDTGAVWVGTASDVIRYRHAREACTAPTGGMNQLSFGSPSVDCTRYATGLTFVVTAGTALTSLSGAQGGAAIGVTKRPDGSFLVTADPSQGPVTLVPVL